MMLAPLTLPASLTATSNLAGLGKPQAASLEGLPIYLLPTGTVTPTLSFAPKLLQVRADGTIITSYSPAH